MEQSLHEIFGSTIQAKSIAERIVLIGVELFELWIQTCFTSGSHISGSTDLFSKIFMYDVMLFLLSTMMM